MGFKRVEYLSAEQKREQRAKDRIRQFVKKRINQKSVGKTNDDEYWQKEFMKGETPEISDESGTEYWGNLLSIIRKDNRKLTKAKAKEVNSKAMRYEPFNSPEPQEATPHIS